MSSSLLQFANGLYDRIGQRLQFVRRDREGRCQIDDIADRTDKHTLRNKVRTQVVQVFDVVEFYHAYGAFHAYVFHASKAPARRKTSLQRGGDIVDLLQTRLALKQIQG